MDKGMEESILRPTCDARDQSLALGEAGGVDGWRPVDTAPRDGTPVILLAAAYVRAAEEWSPEAKFGPRVAIGQWNADGTSWVDQYGRIDGDAHHLENTGVWSSEGGWFQPNEVTHWMPLPELPQTPT